MTGGGQLEADEIADEEVSVLVLVVPELEDDDVEATLEDVDVEATLEYVDVEVMSADVDVLVREVLGAVYEVVI